MKKSKSFEQQLKSLTYNENSNGPNNDPCGISQGSVN